MTLYVRSSPFLGLFSLEESRNYSLMSIRLIGEKIERPGLMAGETSRLNVLMVATRYFPYTGGVETHVYEVGRRLASRGINITVLTTVPYTLTTPLPKEEVIEGMRIIRVRAWPARR